MNKTFTDRDGLEHEDWCWDYDKNWDCTCSARLNMMSAELEEETTEQADESTSTADASPGGLPAESTAKNQ